MKIWLSVFLLLGNVSAFAGTSMVIEDINPKTVRISGTSNKALNFLDKNGNIFFVLCKNSFLNKTVTVGFYGKTISTHKGTCESDILGIDAQLKNGKKLASLAIDILPLEPNLNQIVIQPIYD